MALEIKQNLKLSQQLVITPQLQQAIKLLQLSRLELQNLVQKELIENPVLEEKPTEEEEKTSKESTEIKAKENGPDEVGTKDGALKEPSNFDWENYLGIYNDRYEKEVRPPPEEMPSYENFITRSNTLQDHLLWQLHLSNLKEEEVEIGEEIIGNIGDDGYLKSSVEDIAATTHTSPEKVVEVLEVVQEFDPLGVGSRDLKECLKRQAKNLSHDQRLLVHLIDEHLEDIEKKNYSAVAKKMGLTMERLHELTQTLSHLEPKPGRAFGGEAAQYIIPDVFVHKIGEEYIIMLNDDGLPKLQVSQFYRKMIQSKQAEGTTKDYINDKLKSALWLIKSIHQRQRTLYKVASSIVKFQKAFLENGVHALKPMVLKDVADDIQMHESTVSRVTTNKYMQTPRGLFELKFFFNNKLSSDDPDGITSEAVKDQIKKMIAQEDPKKPLSDQLIAETLQKTNINIARRTVAKYREVLRILPSSKRRQPF